MEFIFNVIFIILLYWTAFHNPTRYVILFIIFHTSYFGLMPKYLLVGSVDYGSIIVCFSSLIAVVARWRSTSKSSKIFICILLVFLIYGLFKPVFDGNQNIILSIKASKSFLNYFFLYYCVAFSSKINIHKVYRLFMFVAFYFTLLYILFSIGIHIIPPYYAKGSLIQCPYDSYIFLAFVLVLAYNRRIKFKILCILIFLFTGIVLGRFFSLTISSLGIVIGVLLYRKVRSKKRFYLIILLGLIVGFILYFIYVPTLESILGSQNDALTSRAHHNEFRVFLIQQHFWDGYGFLDKGSKLVLSVASQGSALTETLSFIDSGYIDMMGRFGLVGSVMLCLTHLLYLRQFRLNDKTIAFFLLVLSFFAINITWSVFTFPMGITVLAIVYVYLNNENNYECNQIKKGTYNTL